MVAVDKKLVLVLGGARSGKSTFAESMAARLGSNVLFVATAAPDDEEMRARIAAHRAARPTDWSTLEEPIKLAGAIREANPDHDLVLIDCVTVWISNLLLAQDVEAAEMEALEYALRQVEELVDAYERGTASFIVIANEVGLGLVPPYPLGRLYRDALGRANQRLAAAADEVYFLVAGLPVALKKNNG